MKKIIDLLEEQVKQAFDKAGYNKIYGEVRTSDRPDLCELDK